MSGLPLHRKRGSSHSPQNSISSDISTCSSSSLVDSSNHHGYKNCYDAEDGGDDHQRRGNSAMRYHPLRIKLLHSPADRKVKLVLCSALALVALCCISSLSGAALRRTRSTEAVRGHTGTATCPVQKWKYPNCKKFLSSGNITAPLTQEKWVELRRVYTQVVGAERSSLSSDWADLPAAAAAQADQLATTTSGFHVPVEVRTAPGKGRGLFTNVDLKKGQQVWDSRHTARFPDECSAKQFFSLISEEDACNTIMWGYVNNYYYAPPTSSSKYEFMLDMDECVYMNEASIPSERNLVGRFVEDTDDARKRRDPGAFGIFATRDIPAGTELVLDYGDIHSYAKLYWYEKLCLVTHGLWYYIAMR